MGYYERNGREDQNKRKQFSKKSNNRRYINYHQKNSSKNL